MNHAGSSSVTPAGATLHDLPTVRPATVRCGWSPVLLNRLRNAEYIRNVGGSAIRLRTMHVSLIPLLLPEIVINLPFGR